MCERLVDQCGYTYAPNRSTSSDDRVAIDRPDYQRCPHAVVDKETGRCLYHHGESQYPRDRFTEQFKHALVDDETASVFAGGRLPGLDLHGETVTTATGAPIDLRGAVIDGDIELTNATIDVPILLDRAAITGTIHADGAVFHAPVSLVDTDISGRLHAHDASVTGGIDASQLDAGYADLREITVDGSLVLDQTSFASNLITAQATVKGDLSAEDAVFDWSLDSTAVTTGGDYTLTGVTVDGDLDLIAADINGDIEMRKATVDGETDVSHAVVGGDLIASDCAFGDDAIFDAVVVDGDATVFDRTTFSAVADLATMALPESRASFSDVTFHDEVWFTHANIGGVADFSGSVFEGMSHLRDAVFASDVIVRNIRTTGQFFLHGSVIHGDLDCTDTSFEHFQFSATVNGKTDFSHTEFLEKAIFRSSTFDDRVWFDNASFAGPADFTDTRFTQQVTFDGTEFLVDPTFDDTRFAIDPDFTLAEFPFADAIDFEDRRSQMILAPPESLQHEGETLPHKLIIENISIPARAAHLVDADTTKTKRIVKAISEFDSSSWHSLVQESLRTARTAVAQLPTRENAVLVFGIQIADANQPSEQYIIDMMLAGVYVEHEKTVIFGHLNPEFAAVDYLIPIPASDDAFSSGAAVATASELQLAAVRNETFRVVVLDKQAETDSSVHSMLVPVLVGSGMIPD